VTEILRAWADGDLGARDRLLPLVYQELRRRAAAHLRRERRDHTLQPTERVHEAYLTVASNAPLSRPAASMFMVPMAVNSPPKAGICPTSVAKTQRPARLWVDSPRQPG
jgi:hypothetical protein